MIGANVIKYPATVKRAYDEGHEIAIHTWTHSYMTTLSNEQIVAELKWTELAIKEIIGVSPRLFRPVSHYHLISKNWALKSRPLIALR
jgi:peptidoglycan/xylan/chitin deacetylase (PgdA/CDA1 family)